MAKHIVVPCKTCQQDSGSEFSPSRSIVSGKMTREDEFDADFLLTLSCGHTVEYTVSPDEKEDINDAINVG